MYPKVIESRRLSILDRDGQRLGFPASRVWSWVSPPTKTATPSAHQAQRPPSRPAGLQFLARIRKCGHLVQCFPCALPGLAVTFVLPDFALRPILAHALGSGCAVNATARSFVLKRRRCVPLDCSISMYASNTPTVKATNDQYSLVSAARSGDRAAFGELYELYARMVRGILLARVPRSEVDDLTHDVFLQAMRRLKTLRDPEAFGPWIAVIARHHATDFHRQSREMAELSVESSRNGSALMEALSILRVIRNLPEAYRRLWFCAS